MFFCLIIEDVLHFAISSLVIQIISYFISVVMNSRLYSLLTFMLVCIVTFHFVQILLHPNVLLINAFDKVIFCLTNLFSVINLILLV